MQCAQLLYTSISAETKDSGQGVATSTARLLRGLSGVQDIPQDVYSSLLRCSVSNTTTAMQLLNLPQAQHITDVCDLLRLSMRRSEGSKVIKVLLR